MTGELLDSMLPYFGFVIQDTPDGLRLTCSGPNHMNAAAITDRTFRAPFTLRTVAKTDSTNLRLYWHLGEVIFNWECSIRELRVHDPATGRQFGIEDKGFISIDEWHEVAWEIQSTGMRLIVDGDLRFARDADYSAIVAPVAIGPCFGSAVTVRSFRVEGGDGLEGEPSILGG